MYIWQDPVDTIDIIADAAWSGCKRNRKSTGGGVLMIGAHCLKTFSKSQSVIAPGRPERALYGIVRGTCEALGLCILGSSG